MSPDTAQRVFEALSKEHSLCSLHLAGGEATLEMDLLLRIIRQARKKGLPVDYLETNASWCADKAKTRERMLQLKEAGLSAILVSVSMFHNEFVPFRRTRTCVETAREVFGSHVILYFQHMYDMLSQMPDDGTHSLEEFCEWAKIPANSDMVPGSYQVIPGGRAVTALRSCYTPHPAENFRQKTCRSELLSTMHFHIDHNGDLFTGLCAGIAAANVENLHPDITGDTHPVFCRLCEHGPYGLMEMAAEHHAFEPRGDGYVSKCDLCLDVRACLHETGEYPELRPAGFYDAG
jgi:hypothetical protein